MEVPEIIERLRCELRVPNERQLARRLEIPLTTLRGWKERGRIPPGAIARIAVAVGRSVEWVRTGQPSRLELATEAARLAEGMPQIQDVERIRQIEELAERVLLSGGVDLMVEVLNYIIDAPRQERDTIRRLIRGLKASPEVRTHLVGQLKLIEKLVQAEKGESDCEPEERPVAKAS